MAYIMSFLWLHAVNPLVSENIQKKFHIYYSIRFLAYNFNETELYKGCFSSEFYKSCYSIISHNTLERLLLN